MRAARRSTFLVLPLAIGAVITASLALAQGGGGTAESDHVVVVRLRPRAGEAREATVVLRNEAGVVGSCRTENGTCEIRGVPAGEHRVTAEIEPAIVTPARPVMIPADGKVSLFVAVP